MSERKADRRPGDGTATVGRRGSAERERSHRGTSRSAESRAAMRYRGSNRAAGHRFGRSVLCLSGIALLTATKLADALTTGIGLRFVPAVYEANPVVEAVLARVGVGTGLIVSSLGVIAVITAITEVAAVAVAVRHRDGHLAPLVRLVGYGLPSALFALVSAYNAMILVAGLRSVELF